MSVFNFKDPVATIKKVNEFMGTNRSSELIQQIADATSFSKMKEGKAKSLQKFGTVSLVQHTKLLNYMIHMMIHTLAI